MCLAVPAKVTGRSGDDAVVRVGDAEIRASLVLVPEAAVGDYVLVHAGFAIQVMSVEEAEATLALLGELREGVE